MIDSIEVELFYYDQFFQLCHRKIHIITAKIFYFYIQCV
jgi:hypothetical protein